MKINFKIILIIFFLIPNIAFGAPSISGINGTVSDRQSVTISGSDFGLKEQAGPLIWETFDSGTNGQALGGWNGWVGYSGNGGTLSDYSPYSGGLCAYNRTTGPSAEDPVSQEFNTSYKTFTASDVVYYSYVSRMVQSGDVYGVYKNGRINASPNTYNGPGSIAISDGYILWTPGDYAVYPDNRYFDGLRSSDWHRHQIFKLNSTPGVADGEVQLFVEDGTVGCQEKLYQNVITRELGYSFQQDSVLLGLMFANTRNDGDFRMYVDDVYVDNTRARVEICDASTWASRTKCDIQIPNEWSGAEITFNVNIPGFIESSESYLYVVDENGEVNTNGFPVVIGSVDIISPGAPINLNVI